MSTYSGEDVAQLKEELIRLVSGALIKEPSFNVASGDSQSEPPSDDDADTASTLSDWQTSAETDAKENPVEKMMRLGAAICGKDGEFLLKLAVYLRQDLGIRGSANFITAIASYQLRCQPFLSVYLPKIISLPSDWLQIATFARDLPLRTQVGLPNALRKALVLSFKAFNEFSLAKYNTESSQKKKKKELAAKGDDAAARRLPYTLKQLIRMLHVSEPRYEVMCLLGKTYPATEQQFNELGLGGANNARSFDAAKANRRMRLEIPRTWETELAAKGNHAFVWDSLVADKKLPFMAMLRNLRNVILQGCVRTTHNLILQKLRSEEQIANSKQFPYRFFSAYDVLNINPETAYDAPQVKREGAPTKPKPKPATAPSTEQLAALLQEYRSALDESVRLACKMNIRPIHGKSLVIIEGDSELLSKVVAQGAKGIGSVRSKLDVALLLAVMLQYACESCELIFPHAEGVTIIPSVDRAVGMLPTMQALVSDFSEKLSAGNAAQFPFRILDNIINRQERIESILIVSANHREHGAGENEYPVLGGLKEYLHRLRTHSNPDLLFVSLAIDGSWSDEGAARAFNHSNDVLLTGFSDSILRFIAERSNGGPRRYIEHIDEVYKIDTSHVVSCADRNARAEDLSSDSSDSACDESDDDDSSSSSTSIRGIEDEAASQQDAVDSQAIALPRNPTSAYRTARWFVSSTFLDMQCERSALATHVFPAVRQWIARRGLKVHVTEIDFRWGVDSDAQCAVSVCLNEISRCAPFVVGITGARYGYINQVQRQRIVPDKDVASADFEWLAHVSGEGVGLSVTEMELRHAVHCTMLQRSTSGHDGACIAVLQRQLAAPVPASLVTSFTETSKDAAQKQAALQAHLQSQKNSGVLLASYRATFAGSTADCAIDTVDFVAKATRLLISQLLARWPDLEEEVNEHGADEELDSCGDTSSSEDASSSDCSANSAESSLHLTVRVEPVAAAIQSNFTARLEIPYVPVKGSMSAVMRFLHGEPVAGADGGSGNAASDASVSAPPRVLLVSSEEGRGKSSFISHVAKTLSPSDYIVVCYSVQAPMAAPGGQQARVLELLTNIAQSLACVLEMDDDIVASITGAAQQASNVAEKIDAVAQHFPSIYQHAAKHLRVQDKTLVVIVDALDALIDEAQKKLLAVLSLLIPVAPPSKRIFWIVSASTASLFTNALRSRPVLPAVYHLPDLAPSERMQLVRNHLALVGKTLQESFRKGNLLRVLCKKPDSGMTTYLMLALTFLRLFSKFDTLKQDIQRLPGTSSQLTNELVRRCELLFTADACCSTLSSLVLSMGVGGIAESDLYRAGSSVQNSVRLVAFLEYNRIVERDACGDALLVSSSASGMVKAVTRKYLSKTAEVDKHHRRLLASYITKKASFSITPSQLSGGDNSLSELITDEWVRRSTPRAVLAVLYHSVCCKQWSVVVRVGSNVEAVAEMIRIGLLPQLATLLDSLPDLDRFAARKLQPFTDFLLQNRHVLIRHPGLAAQLALNMPSASPVHSAAVSSGLGSKRSWVEWLNRHVHGEKECTATTQWSALAVNCLAFSPCGSTVAAGGRDWCCRIMDTVQGTINFQLKHPNSVTAVVFSSSGKYLYTGCADGILRTWSLADGALVQEGCSHTRQVNDVFAFPQDKGMGTVSDDTTLMIWGSGARRPVTGSLSVRPLRTIRQHNAPVSCCAVHQSGSVFASAAWDGAVFVNGLEKDSRVTHFNTRHGCSVRCLAFVPSMVQTIAVGSFNGMIDLFDVAGEVVSATFDEHCAVPITSLHISSDAKFMLSSDTSGCLKVWRQSVTGEVVGSFNGHVNAVCATVFHPSNSNVCVSAAEDGSSRQWTMAAHGIDIPVGAVHDSAVAALAVSANGDFVVSASRSGTAKVFNDFAARDRWSTWLHIRPKVADGQRRQPLCYAAVLLQDTVIVLGDIVGNVSAWGARTGLEGSDAPLLFSLSGEFVNPIRGVWCSPTTSSWFAVCNGGRRVEWTTSSMDFAVNADVSVAEVCSLTSLGTPVLAALLCPTASATLIFSESAVHVTLADCVGDDSEDMAYATLASEADDVFQDVPDDQPVCFCTDASQHFVAAGLVHGALMLKAMSSEAIAAHSRPLIALLKDDRHGGPLQFTSVCLTQRTADTARLRVACSGTDSTVRIFSTSLGSKLVLIGLFHATAAVSSLRFAGHASDDFLIAGDRLGNVYSLLHHEQPSFDDDETEQTTEASSVGLATTSASGRSFSTQSTDESFAASSVSYAEMFSEIGKPMPRFLSSDEKKAWMRRQRDLLRSAAQLQREEPEARLALRRHAEQAMRSFGVFASLSH